MFHAAVLRLTLWYLALLMLLCAFFSLALYRVSTGELDQAEQRLQSLLHRSFLLEDQPGFVEFNQARLDQIAESRRRIEFNLLYFNAIILLAGGGASYLLARRTLQPIEETLEAQQRFTADASHELRTPLTAMKSEIEVALRDRGLTLADSKELHKSTLEEIDRLEALSNGLLTLARQDTDAPLQAERCRIDELVDEAITRVRAAAKQRGIRIERTVGAHAVDGERWALTEALVVLLDNAVKYSPTDSEVAVQATGRHHGQQVAVSVSNPGPGIAAADLPYIFDRFYRADQSRTKGAASGYGLGLSIAKKIVDRHHGELTAQSEADKGTTFTMILPSRHAPWKK